MAHEGCKEVAIPDFAYQSRVTIMPVVSASERVGPSLWVFKGCGLPYCEVLIDGRVHAQTVSTFLPEDALVTLEQGTPGVPENSFMEWVKRFIASIQDLTKDE